MRIRSGAASVGVRGPWFAFVEDESAATLWESRDEWLEPRGHAGGWGDIEGGYFSTRRYALKVARESAAELRAGAFPH